MSDSEKRPEPKARTPVANSFDEIRQRMHEIAVNEGRTIAPLGASKTAESGGLYGYFG